MSGQEGREKWANISGAAPFLPDNAADMLILPGTQTLLIICYIIVSATGEKIGCIGLIVPDSGPFSEVSV
ncbi:hypothetical protein [Methanoplanus endosymbiosus]|uniref:Uncharacterized protein n=1 Tax=Methanoplanus endosymbiosus TaxID=33865 RepID=A0A9E7PPS8_9EURY|nr:hypothetical protein [Methanoplanus endosymbiosus]UUX91372.1 hypothetical protein L6E24_08260 [Methanoplanus endosymbiosus]